MDPISNVDRLVLLLRQRLLERTKASGAAGRRAPTGTVSREPLNIQALAAVEGIDDRQLRRSLIQGILSERFGEEMVNEPKFQQVVDRVADALSADSDGDALMTQITQALRAAAR